MRLSCRQSVSQPHLAADSVPATGWSSFVPTTIGPSMTQGATIRSQRNAARKVNVRQRPCGSLAIRRVPRGECPWRRVILVLAQVSSMNTRRLGSSRPWYCCHWTRRRAMSARSCSLAYRLFFKTVPFALEEPPHCAVARRRAALSQFGHHGAQGQIRLLADPRQQRLSLACEQQLFPAPHPLGRRAAARPPALRPLHNAGHAHPKQRRRRPARAAARNRTIHTIPQVLRIGSCHLMLAPSPSQHLESQNPKYGNPLFDSAC